MYVHLQHSWLHKSSEAEYGCPGTDEGGANERAWDGGEEDDDSDGKDAPRRDHHQDPFEEEYLEVSHGSFNGMPVHLFDRSTAAPHHSV